MGDDQKDFKAAVQADLIRHEGLRLKPYRCTANRLTIGIGRNLDDKGISEDEARYLLGNDITECETDLMGLFDRWDEMTPNWKRALINLRFNLGPGGFRSFSSTIAAIRRGDWETARNNVSVSKWARQVQPSRVEDILFFMGGRIYTSK